MTVLCNQILYFEIFYILGNSSSINFAVNDSENERQRRGHISTHEFMNLFLQNYPHVK